MYDLPSLKDWGDDRWRKKAACKGADVTWFFPKRFAEDREASISDGRLICASCSVRKECLNFATVNSLTHGLYGGVTPRERRLGTTHTPQDGSMMFSTIVYDFRRVYGVSASEMSNDNVLEKLSNHTNIPVKTIRQMVTSKKEYLIPPDGGAPQETHLYGKSSGTSDQT